MGEAFLFSLGMLVMVVDRLMLSFLINNKTKNVETLGFPLSKLVFLSLKVRLSSENPVSDKKFNIVKVNLTEITKIV